MDDLFKFKTSNSVFLWSLLSFSRRSRVIERSEDLCWDVSGFSLATDAELGKVGGVPAMTQLGEMREVAKKMALFCIEKKIIINRRLATFSPTCYSIPSNERMEDTIDFGCSCSWVMRDVLVT